MARNVQRREYVSSHGDALKLPTRFALFLLTTLIACGTFPFTATPTPTPSPKPTRLEIYADADLANVLRDIGNAFTQTNPEVKLEWTFAEPNALRAKLAQGELPDLVLSADNDVNDEVGTYPAIVSKRVATDSLVIVVTKANPARLDRMEDLNQPGLRIALAAESTNLGQATRTLIENFRHDAAFGPDFPAMFYDSVTAQADDARGVLNAILDQHADVGIVYASQADTERNRITVLNIDSGLNVSATYAVTWLLTGHDSDRVSHFVNSLDSPQAQTLWRDYGFEPIQ